MTPKEKEIYELRKKVQAEMAINDYGPTHKIVKLILEERERCAKEAENTQDVCDCADRIAARIREA
jgi:hypothetical protein